MLNAQVPVVKSVVETPAEISHEVTAHSFVHHVSPLLHPAAPVLPAPALPAAEHVVKPFVSKTNLIQSS